MFTLVKVPKTFVTYCRCKRKNSVDSVYFAVLHVLQFLTLHVQNIQLSNLEIKIHGALL